jgi:hypothetical protein
MFAIICAIISAITPVTAIVRNAFDAVDATSARSDSETTECGSFFVDVAPIQHVLFANAGEQQCTPTERSTSFRDSSFSYGWWCFCFVQHSK